MQRIEKYLFGILVFSACLLILIPKYYITGDGPSHTYNAKVLFDYIRGNQKDFYNQYYFLQKSIDPNFSAQILLGVALQILPQYVADKFVQLLYVLLFAYGLRYLIRSIQRENGFVSFLFYPFCFTLVFQQGFYNYGLGLAFLFFSAGYFIRHLLYAETISIFRLLSFAILLFACTLSHGMALILTLLLLCMLFVVQYGKKLFSKTVFEKILYLLLAASPSLLLMAIFSLKNSFSGAAAKTGLSDKLSQLYSMLACQSTRHIEKYPAQLSALLIVVFLLIGLFRRKIGHAKLFVSFVAYAFAILLLYLLSPAQLSETGSIEIRLSFLIPLFLLISLSTLQWPKQSKLMFILAAFMLQMAFSAIRLPYLLQVSQEAEEVMKVEPYLKDKSVMISLHYNDYGQTYPLQLDNAMLHLNNYLGCLKNKHIIHLDNYEAELLHFSLNWRPHIRPRTVLPDIFPGTYPPIGDLALYEQKSGVKINYVLTYNQVNQNMAMDHISSTELQMKAFIQNNFKSLYRNNFVELWARIKLF